MKNQGTKQIIILLLALSGICVFYLSGFAGNIAGIDFSKYPDGNANLMSISNWQAKGADKNPYYEHSLRLLYEGSSLRVEFKLPSNAESGTLYVNHLTSKSDQCAGDGYAPVTIRVNGVSIVSNYDVASNHGGSHGYEKDFWDISDALNSGKNVIEWRARKLCTHYWLKNFKIVYRTQPGSDANIVETIRTISTGTAQIDINLLENGPVPGLGFYLYDERSGQFKGGGEIFADGSIAYRDEDKSKIQVPLDKAKDVVEYWERKWTEQLIILNSSWQSATQAIGSALPGVTQQITTFATTYGPAITTLAVVMTAAPVVPPPP